MPIQASIEALGTNGGASFHGASSLFPEMPSFDHEDSVEIRREAYTRSLCSQTRSAAAGGAEAGGGGGARGGEAAGGGATWRGASGGEGAAGGATGRELLEGEMLEGELLEGVRLLEGELSG